MICLSGLLAVLHGAGVLKPVGGSEQCFSAGYSMQQIFDLNAFFVYNSLFCEQLPAFVLKDPLCSR